MKTDTILMMVAALVCAGAVSFLATPLVRVMAYKVGAVDVPKDSRRIHTHPCLLYTSGLIVSEELDKGQSPS